MRVVVCELSGASSLKRIVGDATGIEPTPLRRMRVGERRRRPGSSPLCPAEIGALTDSGRCRWIPAAGDCPGPSPSIACRIRAGRAVRHGSDSRSIRNRSPKQSIWNATDYCNRVYASLVGVGSSAAVCFRSGRGRRVAAGADSPTVRCDRLVAGRSHTQPLYLHPPGKQAVRVAGQEPRS